MVFNTSRIGRQVADLSVENMTLKVTLYGMWSVVGQKNKKNFFLFKLLIHKMDPFFFFTLYVRICKYVCHF